MTEPQSPRIATAESARRAARMMNLGNIVAMVLPFPLLIFWFGASMFVYAMNRHHPNPKVGHYTQQAAYRLYAVTGALIVMFTAAPRDNVWVWVLGWVAAAAALVPLSVRDLRRIQQDDWQDTPIVDDHHHHP